MGRTIITERDVPEKQATEVYNLSEDQVGAEGREAPVEREAPVGPEDPAMEFARELARDLGPDDLRQLIEDADQEGNMDSAELFRKALRAQEEQSAERPDVLPQLAPPVSSPMRAPSTATGVDTYVDKLLKYIPAESVVLYLTLQGVILSGAEETALPFWLWFIFVIGVVGTPLYLWRIQKVNKKVQLAVSAAAFAVWVFALGGAFEFLVWYEPFIGSVALVVFTFFVPFINPDLLGSQA